MSLIVSYADPERHYPSLQGISFPAHFGAIGTHQYHPREYPD